MLASVLRPRQTDATNHNIVACVGCAASVCMGLKVLPVSNYTQQVRQQVPTLLWFHTNGRNMLGPTMLRVVGQQCCVRLHLKMNSNSVYPLFM